MLKVSPEKVAIPDDADTVVVPPSPLGDDDKDTLADEEAMVLPTLS